MKEYVKQDILSGNYDRLYNTQDWARKRVSILKRDCNECQRCLGKYVGGHPIKRIKITTANTVHHIVEMKDDPSRMLDDDNLVSLCHDCHDIIHDRKPVNFNRKRKIVSDERW